MIEIAELCRTSQIFVGRVIELLKEGIIEPLGTVVESRIFRGVSLWRVRCAQWLGESLGINTPGLVPALDLEDGLERIRARLDRPEH